MEKDESKISINVMEVLKDFLHKWWIVLIASVVGACALFVYTFFTTEQKYTATAEIYVNSSTKDNIQQILSGELQASRSLVNTYAVLMETYNILEDVRNTAVEAGVCDEKDPTKPKYSYSQLKSMIKVGSVKNTEVCSISITCADPDDAKVLANITMHVFITKLNSIVEGSSAKVVDYAVEATPVSRGFTKMALIGFAVGFVLSLAVIFLVDFYVNDTFQDTESLKQCLPDDIPVLTIIPDTEVSNTGKYGYYKKYGHYAKDYTYSYYQETVADQESDGEGEDK